MPIHSVSGPNYSRGINQSFKAEKQEAKAPAVAASTSDKAQKSKLPYVAGAVVLAGLGILGAKKLINSKNIKNAKQTAIDAIKSAEDAAKTAKDKIDDVIPAAKDKVDDVVKKGEEVVSELKNKAEEIAESAVKAETKVEEKASQVINPVVIENKDKAPKLTPKEDIRAMAKDAKEAVVIAEEKAPQAVQKAVEQTAVEAKNIDKNIEPEKKNAISGLVESLKGNAKKIDKSVSEYNEFNSKHFQEANRIIGENSWSGWYDLPKIEKVAGDFALDKNRPDNIKQAANILEQAYRDTYIHSQRLTSTQDGTNQLLNRVTKESDQLFKIYAEMPIEEVPKRIRTWVVAKFPSPKEYPYAEGVMPHEEFITKMVEGFNDFLQKKV